VNKIIYFISFLFFIGCSSIKFITIEHGKIVTNTGQPINLVGNPRLTCYSNKGEIIADGYFVRQDVNNAFIIDEFGKTYVTISNPVCRLGRNESAKN
jgi:hypothetical protein